MAAASAALQALEILADRGLEACGRGVAHRDGSKVDKKR
jgi:hypothetical protein